ncbi:MAG TPA: AraC family transcriptional regulator, partial [Modicisalibacter sp.]|nr:AraC family transcriptional regulator [Modicisalibacter sp.]
SGATALAGWLSEALGGDAGRVVAPRLRLLRLLPTIEADLARPWRIREMASYCHLAEAAFARQFRALTGQSPHAWLVERRLIRACELMGDCQASLTEIALVCGFGDAAHFSRVFRSHHGCSPRQWRRAHYKPTNASSPDR